LTGLPNGCGQLYAGSPYNVCNSLDISTWNLQVDFTANVEGLPSSPLTFNSIGSVGPTDALFDNPAQVGNLSFDLVNLSCSPTCDAYISKIILTGTLDTSTLQLYNGLVGGPYIVDSLSSASFSTTWNINPADYTAPTIGANATGNIYDSTDIIITNTQGPPPPPPDTPEPGSVWLLVAGVIGIGFLKRTMFARA
jgi:hypothetical protein